MNIHNGWNKDRQSKRGTGQKGNRIQMPRTALRNKKSVKGEMARKGEGIQNRLTKESHAHTIEPVISQIKCKNC